MTYRPCYCVFVAPQAVVTQPSFCRLKNSLCEIKEDFFHRYFSFSLTFKWSILSAARHNEQPIKRLMLVWQ